MKEKQEDIFSKYIEIQNPFGERGKSQVATKPIGPASLGDLRLLVARGVYGGLSEKHSAPYIVTLPELVAFLDEVKRSDYDLYTRITRLPGDNPLSRNENARAIEAVTRNVNLVKHFKMREASYEGEGSGLAIAGNTVFYIDTGVPSIATDPDSCPRVTVRDNPHIEFDNYKGTLYPRHFPIDTHTKPQKIEGRVRIFQLPEGHLRILPSLEELDYVPGGWGDELLVALLGSQDLAMKSRKLDPLTISPLPQNFFECSQPRPCVAALRKRQNASVYVGGYSAEGRERYYVFLARQVL